MTKADFRKTHPKSEFRRKMTFEMRIPERNTERKTEISGKFLDEFSRICQKGLNEAQKWITVIHCEDPNSNIIQSFAKYFEL